MRGDEPSGGERERRKALVAQYKRTPKLMGVYRVHNRANGRTLLGASRDLRARLNRHRMNLVTGTEMVTELQRDWRTFGPEVFEFEILDTLEPLDRPDYDPTDDLATLESLWDEKLAGQERYRR